MTDARAAEAPPVAPPAVGPPPVPATPADAPDVARLARAVIPGAWSERGFARAAAAADGIARVVRDRGRVVGYLEARTLLDELHLVGIAVDPAWRRRGLASALLRDALAEAAERGAETVHLEVRAGNPAALGLYARFGFEVVGRRRRYYADGEDAVLLSGSLGRAAGAR